MEPEDGADPVDPGPNVLDTGLPAAELHRRMQWALDRADGLGIVGINNHMGSKFTADRGAMTSLMQELSARGQRTAAPLFFGVPSPSRCALPNLNVALGSSISAPLA